MTVGLRDGLSYGQGDLIFVKDRKYEISRIDTAAREAALVDLYVDTVTGERFHYTEIDHYEKAAVTQS